MIWFYAYTGGPYAVKLGDRAHGVQSHPAHLQSKLEGNVPFLELVIVSCCQVEGVHRVADDDLQSVLDDFDIAFDLVEPECYFHAEGSFNFKKLKHAVFYLSSIALLRLKGM
jgi:hypothetical protein